MADTSENSFKTPNKGETDSSRTIFILGFPEDMKDRELRNLLIWHPGFQDCQINYKSDRPTGFALFSTRDFALDCKNKLQGFVFDANCKSVLRAEMAKKNLIPQRAPNRTIGMMPIIYDTNYQYVSGNTDSNYMVAPQQHPETVRGSSAISHSQFSSKSTENPPCNTLFVGNLIHDAREDELTALFSMQPGFKQLKLVRRNGGDAMCFVEMDGVHSAVATHSSLQGAILRSCHKGGIRIQYSKSPFGRKKSKRT